MNLDNFEKHNNVIICTNVNTNFSEKYIEIRNKEKRILTDKEVILLPCAIKSNPNYNEWKLRKSTCDRFLSYVSKKQNLNSILEIGCGNGWFANKISDISKTYVIGIDINLQELEQASRIFKKDNLNFIYKNIFEKQIEFKNQFDIIVINASIQYFEDFEDLINTLEFYLTKNGEIHILDSHFYTEKKISSAKENSKKYYYNFGTHDMNGFTIGSTAAFGAASNIEVTEIIIRKIENTVLIS